MLLHDEVIKGLHATKQSINTLAKAYIYFYARLLVCKQCKVSKALIYMQTIQNYKSTLANKDYKSS